jgi:hypothetical protein
MAFIWCLSDTRRPAPDKYFGKQRRSHAFGPVRHFVPVAEGRASSDQLPRDLAATLGYVGAAEENLGAAHIFCLTRNLK